MDELNKVVVTAIIKSANESIPKHQDAETKRICRGGMKIADKQLKNGTGHLGC